MITENIAILSHSDLVSCELAEGRGFVPFIVYKLPISFNRRIRDIIIIANWREKVC